MIAYFFPIVSTFRSTLILALVLLLGACSSNTELNPAYYSQSIGGHLSLMMSGKKVDELLVESEDDKLRERLQTAQEIRRYAINSLSLPNNKSYTQYVQLQQRYPVWNIVAAKELSLKPKQWCYLVIGCAAYRGYYDKDDAVEYAQGLRDQGYDVVVGGVPAYSTLGWFADPLTSAIVRRNDANLAELMFHELAHQRVFIKSDSRFNEAFASAVGEQGALVWLQQTGQKEKLKKYQTQLRVYGDFLELIRQTRVKLERVYNSEWSDDDKLAQKQRVFTQMRDDYAELKVQRWQGVGWYDNWFKRPLNNARFVSIATYRDLVPDFVALLSRCDGDFARFYRTVEAIGKTEEKDLDVACAQ